MEKVSRAASVRGEMCSGRQQAGSVELLREERTHAIGLDKERLYLGSSTFMAFGSEEGYEAGQQ